MLKSSFPQLNWDEIVAIGFDLDGTLYDEYDFIHQAYLPIADLFARECRMDARYLHRTLLARWVEKGSSYNRIFSDVLAELGRGGEQAAPLILESLRLFRTTQPELRLSKRVQSLLDDASESRAVFLVTDGTATLQESKFAALGLGRWFPTECRGFTGTLGSTGHKPSTAINQTLPLLAELNPRSVVYLGDRDIDRQYADAAGFQFARVRWFQTGA